MLTGETTTELEVRRKKARKTILEADERDGTVNSP